LLGSLGSAAETRVSNVRSSLPRKLSESVEWMQIPISEPQDGGK
jgi:hypothetical protein